MADELKSRYLITIHDTTNLRITINEKYYLGTDTKKNCC